jgi:hypothetical protein
MFILLIDVDDDTRSVVFNDLSLHDISDMERGVQVPRRQGLPVLTMGKTLKFSATSATMLPGTKKVKWPGRFSNIQKKFVLFFCFLFFFFFRV